MTQESPHLGFHADCDVDGNVAEHSALLRDTDDADESHDMQEKMVGAEPLFSWYLWFMFFVIGTINNAPFVVVGSASQSIVRSFNVGNLIGENDDDCRLLSCRIIMPKQYQFDTYNMYIVITFYVHNHIIGVVQWANVAFGFFARGLNMFLVNVSFLRRAILNFVMMVIGVLGLAIFCNKSFAASVCFITLIGRFRSQRWLSVSAYHQHYHRALYFMKDFRHHSVNR